jgi:filamentous hemagglutinin family protein
MKPKTLLSLLAATGAFLHAEMASAQALPPSVRTPQADQTLGTQVSGTNNNFTVTGGLNRGQTLFHSFKDFSIPTGGAANFNNPVGTRDIITRVTGNLFSDLNGTLNSNGANFLLINPNGVVFGPNARLNVGKAFAASTASGVDLIDGQGRQITFGTKPGGDAPLLKINPNVFLNISRLNMGASVPNNPGIVNYGKLQTNNDSQYIGLIGGNVTLDGKYGGGKIIAPGGRIDLGGLNSAGTVSTDAQGLVFGGNGLTLGDVLLTNDASVSARANQTLGTVNPFFSSLASTGSNININANNLNILNSGAKFDNGLSAIDNGLEKDSGFKTKPAGDININTTDQVNLDNADIKNTLRGGAEGKIGDININANSLKLINASAIVTSTFGKGDAGNIKLKTTGDISISGIRPQFTRLITKDSERSDISSGSYGIGNAGKITIDTQNRGNLTLLNGARITSKIEKNAIGNGGDIQISAREIDLKNNSVISSSNVGGKGNAGNIDLKTIGDIRISDSTPSRSVNFFGDNLNLISSAILSSVGGRGNAGNITIDTQDRGKLSLLNGANINSSIQQGAVGNGGDIAISARKIDLGNNSTISSTNGAGAKLAAGGAKLAIAIDTIDGGDAGNINIKTTDALDISNGSYIVNINLGRGKIGNISIASDRVTLNNNSFIVSASSGGKGGNIQLTTLDRLLLRNESGIVTDSLSAVNKADGGNITISSPLIIALPGNNDISANANGGNGGRVDIISKGLFGIQFRPRLSDLTNDITVSSTFGQSGIVNISTPGTDPGKDSTVLPTVPTDASNQIAQTCGASRENKFVVAGRGGLPANANDPLTSDVVWQDARGTNSQPTASSATTDPTKLAPPATGLVFDGKGKATLIAAGTQGQPTGTSVVCPTNVVRK